MMVRWVILFLLLLLAACDARAASSAGEDIAAFCKQESLSRGPSTPTVAACIGRQREALKHYLGIWVMFDAGEAEAKRCMLAGRVERTLSGGQRSTVPAHVDWLKAEACLRSWAKGRQPVTAAARPKG